MSSKPVKRRLLLKISGEVLGGQTGVGLDAAEISRIAGEIAAAIKAGVQVGLVVGGGNFIRGAEISAVGIPRVTGDQMGMLGTVMNGLAMGEAIRQHEVGADVFTALPATHVARPYSARGAVEVLERGEVAILAGGTGNPYFTTDTCGALRAIEIQADLLLKGTKVAGVYSADPVKNPQAELYERVSFAETLERRLKIMDTAAFALCQEHRLPIRVFDMITAGNIERALLHNDLGTEVFPSPDN